MTALRRVAPGLELPRHLRAAGRALAYLLLGLVNGAVYLLLIGGGLALAALLSVVWIGLPLLSGVTALAWRLTTAERHQVNRLLAAHLPPMLRPPRRQGPAWRRGLDELSRRAFWTGPALLMLRLPVAALCLAVAGAPLALTVALGVLGVQGLSGPDADRLVGPWALGPAVGLALCALALVGAVVSIGALELAGQLLRQLSRRLLRRRSPAGGPVRELLAERLGDRSLSIAYWLPEQRRFVDDGGRPVELPDPGSGRTWTAVDRDGQRVAAIVHDAELDASPELVQAAASAAALAIDNERLKADLRARVEDLRISRLRIVEAADDARRQIERDLHDGAQQQLVSLALDLRVLRARLTDDPEAAATVDELNGKLADALSELRELARGIHPAVLSERGLAAAVDAIVARAPLPVDSDVVLEERFSAPVEAAAYFVVAEGLTNVVKYAHASFASVRVRREPGDLVVEVSDDGIGGADPADGTGLRGLVDRLAVLDGRLFVDSPRGAGTRLEARIPCHADALTAEARR